MHRTGNVNVMVTTKSNVIMKQVSVVLTFINFNR